MPNVSPDFIMWSQIKGEFEGCKLMAYIDTGGVWTIGYGTTYLYDKGRKVRAGDFLSKEDAVRYWQYDSQETVRLANFYIKKELNITQSTAICDYIYNRGIGNFLSTRLDELININPNDPQISEEIKRTGLTDRLRNILNGLIRRRKCEAFLYQNGILRFNFK